MKTQRDVNIKKFIYSKFIYSFLKFNYIVMYKLNKFLNFFQVFLKKL